MPRVSNSQGVALKKKKASGQIAQGFFDSPIALLHLAHGRADELRMLLGWCDDKVWVALFDFAVTINCLRDWVRVRHPELKDLVEVVEAERSIQACKDIANTGKHLDLVYQPSVRKLARTDVLLPGTLNAAGLPDQRVWRLSVVLADGTSAYMEDVAAEALSVWDQFFERNGIS
jgi:hypothetical protein